jgi:rhamnogalacturonyl hydrolase YesR
VRALSFGTKYGRIAWTQLFRRLPINFRRLALVPKGHNPKGIGLFLWGYSRLARLNVDSDSKEKIQHLLELLEHLRTDNYPDYCWGYNFPWQSRAFNLPRWTPTIVNTSFIGHGLLDTYKVTGEQRALDMAHSATQFMLNDLNRTPDGNTFCFSYTPLDQTMVHNANLMGASLLVRVFEETGEDQLRDAALSSLEYSMKYQHEDGSWFYAEPKMQNWIDSFHTGFNLQAIRYFLDLGYAAEHRDNYEKGVRYYAEKFFLDDGTPKYYHDSVYPIDIHSPAQAVVFFSGEGEGYQALTERVLGWMLENMWDERGYFYFRKGRYFTNKIPYMRWSQAWAWHALTEYLLQTSSIGNTAVVAN